MRFFIFAAALLCMLTISIPTAHAADSQYVEITESFANIYQFLDPKSPIIVQVKKSDHVELINAGTLWYQVKYKDQTGWLERKSGNVVASNKSFPWAGIITLIICLVAGIVGYIVLIRKPHQAKAIHAENS